jgi:hypothetical protein
MWTLALVLEWYFAVRWLADGVDGAGNVLIAWVWFTAAISLAVALQTPTGNDKIPPVTIAMFILRMAQIGWLIWFGAWFTALALLLRTLALLHCQGSRSSTSKGVA